MEVHKGIQVRIIPTKSQRESIERHFGHNRFVWNYFLEKRKREYEEEKKTSSFFKDSAALTLLKQEKDWLYEVSVNSQQRTLKNLDAAYRAFFRKKAKFPNFKTKSGNQSFSCAANLKIEGNKIYISRFKDGFRFRRKLPEFIDLKNVTIKKTASGKYYAVLCVVSKVAELPKTGREVGIDLGLTDFAVFSNGSKIKTPKFFREHENALKKAQKHLDRKKKGSKRRQKQRIKVAKIHEKIANSRKNFLHNASSFTVKHFDFVGLESLAVTNMVKNRKLSKSISDAGWSEFARQLSYKGEWYGKTIVQIGRYFPSSKTCNSCGYLRPKLSLSERAWKCPTCDLVHDRDLNASLNILNEAKKWERQSSITNLEAA